MTEEYLNYLEVNGKLDDYYAMIEQEHAQKETLRAQQQEIFPMVRSALSGNGKLLVNRLIRKHIKQLTEEYNDFNRDVKYEMYNFYTKRIVSRYDNYDPDREKTTLQSWVNWEVLRQLDHDYGKIEPSETIVITECELASKFESTSFSDIVSMLSDCDRLNQEDLVIIKDTVEKLGNENAWIYLNVYSGIITKKDAYTELGISKPTFDKRYELFKKTMEELINENN